MLAYAIGWVIQKTIGFRITNEDEIAGVDTVVHGEEGYAARRPRLTSCIQPEGRRDLVAAPFGVPGRLHPAGYGPECATAKVAT